MGFTYGFGVEKGGTMVRWEKVVGGTFCFFLLLFTYLGFERFASGLEESEV